MNGFPELLRRIDPPDEASLRALVSSFSPEMYYVDPDAAREALCRRAMFNVIDNATGWKVDFIFAHRSLLAPPGFWTAAVKARR